MSIKFLSAVWADYPGDGSRLLVLLALADYADDGGVCFPSMAAIAKKTRLSTHQARRMVHALTEEGIVEIIGNHWGGAPGATRRYRINLEGMTASTGATPSMDATPSTHAPDGLHPCTETASTGASLTVNEPSLTVSNKSTSRKSSEKTFSQFMASCKESGEKPIPESDPVFQYVEQVGIDHEMLKACWQEFKSAYLSSGKKQKDWRAHFRNAVRRNWYKLWFLKEGMQAQWTTAGEQARRAQA